MRHRGHVLQPSARLTWSYASGKDTRSQSWSVLRLFGMRQAATRLRRTQRVDSTGLSRLRRKPDNRRDRQRDGSERDLVSLPRLFEALDEAARRACRDAPSVWVQPVHISLASAERFAVSRRLSVGADCRAADLLPRCRTLGDRSSGVTCG